MREEHAILDGITLPFDDKFWDEFFPPNGWNCRCEAIQVSKKRYEPSNPSEALARGCAATYKPNADGVNKAAIFRFNLGKEQRIFPKKHPYFPKGCGDCGLNQYATGKGRPMCTACKIINDLIVFDISTKRGRVYYINPQPEHELPKNVKTATFLANTFNYKIQLLKPKNINGVKNADSYNETLNIYQEYKVNKTGSKRSIEDNIRDGRKQSSYIVLRFDIDIDKDFALQKISDSIMFLNKNIGIDPNNKIIEEVFVIFNNGEYTKIKKE